MILKLLFRFEKYAGGFNLNDLGQHGHLVINISSMCLVNNSTNQEWVEADGYDDR